MEKCYKTYTVINSQHSVGGLKKLMNVFFDTFGIINTIDDIFYYGVFCKPQNYSNFEFDTREEYDFEIPEIILSACAKEKEKYEYVQRIIGEIMRKEIKKPEWMKYIEMNMTCDVFGQPPSTFLYIEVKDHKYDKLAQSLIEFLYSPNLTITMTR